MCEIPPKRGKTPFPMDLQQLKCFQLQGGFAPQTPIIGSRSRARHVAPLIELLDPPVAFPEFFFLGNDPCGKCRSGHIGTIWQGWTTQEWTIRHHVAEMEFAGVDNAAPLWQGWTMREWTMQEWSNAYEKCAQDKLKVTD